MKLGCHIHETPNGRYTFVGSVPVTLCEDRDATEADVLGCRAHRREDGSLGCYKVRSFSTENEARAFAMSVGAQLSN